MQTNMVCSHDMPHLTWKYMRTTFKWGHQPQFMKQPSKDKQKTKIFVYGYVHFEPLTHL